MNLLSAKSLIGTKLLKGKALLSKNSSGIFLIIGIGGVIASTVMACNASRKVDFIIDTAKDRLDDINEALETHPEQYKKEDQVKDLAITYAQTGVEFIKLYGPSVVLGVSSIACIVGSHNILKKENLILTRKNAALVAAYNLLDRGFKDYRGRVREEFGEQKDYELRHGVKSEVVEAVEVNPETGKTKKTKKSVVKKPASESIYARFFDELSTEWMDNAEYNLLVIKNKQDMANDILHSRGHLFLNEVYEMLGIPHSKAGAIVGWTISPTSDNYVDFGLFEGKSEQVRAFINGYEKAILLDFNVDGPIFEQLP